MSRAGFFFEQRDHLSEAGKPYYRYLGYCREDGEMPVCLHFSRDEMVFSFADRQGRVLRVFSLYVAGGELNQAMLRDKIENYWQEPIWCPPARDGGKDKNDSFKINIVNHLAQESYFSLLVSEDKDDANRIDFRRLLLDFLFELEFTSTFEDENFFHLQPALQDNLLLDALVRKCRYLREKRRAGAWAPKRQGERLPRPFRQAEEAWLKVCFQEPYLKVFTSRLSLFVPVEDEVATVIFRNRIGKRRQSRRRLFHPKDIDLRNQLATFFLRRYSIINAFRALMSPWLVGLTPVVLLSLPFGDLACSIARGRLPGKASFQLDLWCRVPVFAYLLPVVMLAAVVAVYWRKRFNLFKLMLPRMFFGIMVGWSIFWTTEELWKAGVTATARNSLLFSLIILALILMYVFTDIRNKLIRVSGRVVLGRALVLVGFAIILSTDLGFYALQFKARPMLENSGFLNFGNRRLLALVDTESPELSTSERKNWQTREASLAGLVCGENSSGKNCLTNRMEILALQTTWGGHNFIELRGHNLVNWLSFLDAGNRDGPKRFVLYFIWSMFSTQVMMSIMAGIILQLLWEDRPITEPL